MEVNSACSVASIMQTPVLRVACDGIIMHTGVELYNCAACTDCINTYRIQLQTFHVLELDLLYNHSFYVCVLVII